LIGVAAALILSDETFERYIRYISIGCASGSAGLAQAFAKTTNQKAQNNDTA
jgi:hypothetical protein